MAQLTPIVYDVTSGEHRPAGAGEQVGVSYIAVDSSSMNLLRSNVTSGLGLFGSDLVSLSSADNILKIDSHGKLYVEKPTLPDFVLLSQQQGNFVRLGSDGGIYLDGNDVLSNADDNMLRIDSTDGKIKLTSAQARQQLGIDSMVIVSEAPGNLLTSGSDGGAMLAAGTLVSSVSGNALQADASGKLYVGVPSAADLVGSNDALLYADSTGKLRTSSVVSTSVTGNQIRTDAAGKIYVTFDDILSSDTKNLTSYDRSGKLMTSLSMAYDRSSGDLSLTSPDGVEIGRVNIPSNGTVLQSATLVTNPIGQPSGTYIQMVFQTSTGGTNTVYIDVGSLIDIYTEGEGISITGNRVSVSVLSGGGISHNSYGNLYVETRDIVAQRSDNLLGLDYSSKLIVAADNLISTSGDNLLSRGTDERLMVDADTVIRKVRSALINANSTGLKVNSDDSIAVDCAQLVSPTAGNLLISDSTGKLYVNTDNIAASIISPTAGAGLTADSNGRLRVDKTALVRNGDSILSGSYDGIYSTIGITYDQPTGKLTLTGNNGQTVATVTIPSSASSLENVTVVTNPAGQPAGTYLAMTFKRSDGTQDTVYVDMSAVGDVYSAGNGIDITNRSVSVKLSANSGLVATANGLAVDKTTAAAQVRSTDAGNALSIGNDGLLYVALDCGEL